MIRFDVSITEFEMLAHLYKKPMTVKELSNILEVDEAGVYPNSYRLTKKGFIKRFSNERIAKYEITQKGIDIITNIKNLIL
jgi:DNA-binding MarR family transcriptional regulator